MSTSQYALATLDGVTGQTGWDSAVFRDRVQGALDAFVDEQAATLAPLGSDADRLVREAHTSVSGGKRFRAAFCYWGHRAVHPSPDDEDALVRACASLELLHASALVHDDYMDASDTRRGRPATHRQLEMTRHSPWPLLSCVPLICADQPTRYQPPRGSLLITSKVVPSDEHAGALGFEPRPTTDA